MIFDDEITMYPLRIDTILTNEVGFTVPSSTYSEAEGDVIITRFKSPADTEGFLTVELTELEDGRKTISGTFEMTVVLDFRYETNFPQQEQDTLHIKNGRYLIELNDKRDE